jgi:hypothetical protein
MEPALSHFDISKPHVNFRQFRTFVARTMMGERSLSNYRARWLVFFSHLADFTPVCTSEFLTFSRTRDVPQIGLRPTRTFGGQSFVSHRMGAFHQGPLRCLNCVSPDRGLTPRFSASSKPCRRRTEKPSRRRNAGVTETQSSIRHLFQ